LRERAAGDETIVTIHSAAGRRAKIAFCQRIVPMKPASSPSAAHCQRGRAPRVAAHAHVKTATAAIEGACDMVGSFTRYQRRKDPVATSTMPNAAQEALLNRAASR
jgi:hypothetical protein